MRACEMLEWLGVLEEVDEGGRRRMSIEAWKEGFFLRITK